MNAKVYTFKDGKFSLVGFDDYRTYIPNQLTYFYDKSAKKYIINAVEFSTSNVDRYLDGTLENPDVWMLANDCGDDAVPSLVRLCRELESRGEKDGVLYLKTLELLEGWSNDGQNSGFFSLTLPRLKAHKVYREYVAQRAAG